jgi:HEAT repeat protein
MRQTAAKAIARQGGSLSYTVLAEALSDTDPGVRRVALAYLMRSSDPRAIRQVVRIAAHGDDALSLQAAARIGQLGYLAVGPLVEALRTSDEVVRGTIGYLMDALEDKDSLVILAKALEEDDPRIVEPVRAAFLRKGPEVAPILAPLAGHPDARVRKTALGLLARWDTASPVLSLVGQ